MTRDYCSGCGGDPEPMSALCSDCAWDLVYSWQHGEVDAS